MNYEFQDFTGNLARFIDKFKTLSGISDLGHNVNLCQTVSIVSKCLFVTNDLGLMC